ncbi:WecB/TagA/CpsF family glycosyltransferase [Cryobacterium roopkundense]|uniref:N-acetylglucosaminyldiphosphoundecaprenol N-acetyl-beta-D-mannosaminyltransferase n=1 Tax=Cryobacterium roopkundense TaxID=1001240 RepID=A0A7W9E4N3_9MICO|nr:WecB/TagA/CpsF family glycosyltransferase [Cryobacterium roopkundense]MBB5642398.1 N-acetylglucosaminyldiphosphoundecaprenol N-acetyl-beta-D-mannosaminyltransferase [Cryobacterium roopkundense]
MSSDTGVHVTPHHGVAHASQWIGPVEFVSSTPQDACDHIIALSLASEGRHVHLANAYTVALADESPDYRATLAAPALNFPDGKPIGWLSKLRRHSPRLRQVRGPQLFLDVFDQGRFHGIKHFLLGSTPEVLSALQRELTVKFPGIKIVGLESPPFRALTTAEHRDQDARIEATGAQIVWVGLGTPKQDVEAHRIADGLPVVAIAIGAAFDFAAGTLRSAPAWMTRCGLEWTFRFAHEPRRLWKRYVFGNARFIKAALVNSGARRSDDD